MQSLSRIAAAAVLSLAITPAWAGQASSWSIEGGIGAVSDYVWRGVSQSQEDPTWQAELEASHHSGFYAGAFLSGVDFTPAGAEDDGIDYEANLYLGWSGALSESLSLELGYNRVIYPGAKAGYGADFNEFSATLGFAEHYSAAVTYSDDAMNLGHDSWYYRLAGDWELGESGFTLTAGLGLFDLGAALGGSYRDYEVSLARTFGPVAAKLSWFDTASYDEALSEALGEPHLADGRLVLSLAYRF